MRLPLALVFLTLAACASAPPKQFPGPNGRPAYAVGCSGKWNSIEDCFAQVALLCPRGYDVITQTDHTYQDANGWPRRVRGITVECKP
jgi:hypothetical protein